MNEKKINISNEARELA